MDSYNTIFSFFTASAAGLETEVILVDEEKAGVQPSGYCTIAVMSTIAPTPPTTTRDLPVALTQGTSKAHTYNESESGSKTLYWSGLVLSRQILRYEATQVNEGRDPSYYGAISTMAAYRNSSLEELRLAYYFYDLKSHGSNFPNAYKPQTLTFRRSWEKPGPLIVPPPDPSQSRSTITGIFPVQPAPSLSTSFQASATNPATKGQLFASQSTKLPEEPPVQAFAALGLSSQATTPVKSGGAGLFGTPVRIKPVNFLRSPAAERIPTVNIAETEWEAALRAVARSKTLLQHAQEEYNKAELRLAYYFYDLSPKGSRVPGGYLPGRMVSRRSWEKSDKLAVPHFGCRVKAPTASLSKSEFTAVFPAAPPPPPSTASQAPPAHVPALGGPLSAGESTKSTEAPPAQTLAPLGLSSQPMTPANSDAVGIFGIPVPSKTVDLPRSPAAERIPAVHTAETEWEGALRAVAWKKTRLQQAQDEYNNAVRVEREKFKVYSEARMNLDK
ncbi:hypothetical protein FRB90_011728 [Tulasnella sp. 427]|nr:hypothetical protein FRB90_011728 [Tulasnella sp. 427]